MSVWIIGAILVCNNFPQMRRTWGNEMYKLEQEDIVEYQRFQNGLTSFFTSHLITQTKEGFEKL